MDPYPVLQIKNVVKIAVEAVGPKVDRTGRLNELPRDSHPVRRLAHAAFQHIAHTELASHLLHIHRAALVDET